MNDVSLRLLDDLSSALENDSRFSSLKKEEEAAFSKQECRLLFEEASRCREAYLTLRLEKGEEDEETILAKKAFHAAKTKLEEEPRVANYREKYAQADAVYRQIDEILFGEYRGHLSCKERHAAR